MSELLQSGQHPDADQLSAFMEQALPAHERGDVLAHLALCSDCRATVALALPPAAVPQRPVAETARRAWFSFWFSSWPSSWIVFVPAAVAVAALALFIVYINRPAKNRLAGPVQMAVSQPPANIQPSAQATASVVAAPPQKPPPIQEKKLASRQRGFAAQQSVESAGTQDVISLPMEGRNLNAAAKVSPAPPSPLAEAQQQSVKFGSAFAPVAGAGLSGVANTQRLTATEEARLKSAAPQAAATEIHRSGGYLVNAAAPPALASETVNVVSAAPLAIMPAGTSSMNVVSGGAPAAAPLRPLPGGLPVLSLATHGRLMVAIDSGNAVFQSNDSGAHWQAVFVEWQGRAVKAALLPQLNFYGDNLGLMAQAEIQPSGSSSIDKKLAAKAPAAGKPVPVFEITTDTGVHWTSADGLIWQRK
jgi:hypothetical protein